MLLGNRGGKRASFPAVKASLIEMERAAGTALRLKFVRGLIVIGALVSLCVSDDVGPRLLPLPSTWSVTASDKSLPAVGDFALPTSVPGEGPGAWVEMAATAQLRSGDRHQHEQAATHAAPAAGPPANLVSGVTAAYHPLFLLSSPVAVPADRGPPRLA